MQESEEVLTLEQVVDLTKKNEYIFGEVAPTIRTLYDTPQEKYLQLGIDGIPRDEILSQEQEHAYLLGIIQWLTEQGIEEVAIAPALVKEPIALSGFIYEMSNLGWRFDPEQEKVDQKTIDEYVAGEKDSFRIGKELATITFPKAFARMKEYVGEYFDFEGKEITTDELWTYHSFINRIIFIEQEKDLTKKTEYVLDELKTADGNIDQAIVADEYLDVIALVEYKIQLLNGLLVNVEAEEETKEEYETLPIYPEEIEALVEKTKETMADIYKQEHNPTYKLQRRHELAVKLEDYETAGELHKQLQQLADTKK